MSVWQFFNAPAGAGYVNAFNEAIRHAEEIWPDFFVPVDKGPQLIVSDYSGQHRDATHDVYAFLITNYVDVEGWLPLHATFRSRWMHDRRRISFKQMREPVRRRAYPHFLELAGALRSNLVTVMIDKGVGSFIEGGPLSLAKVLDDCFPPSATGASIERIYRLALLIAMLQAGLRREDQPSLWISDHDEALDSFTKRENFARLASYLTFGLSGRRYSADHVFLTTETEGLPAWVEDLAAFPDIAAGACTQLSGVLPSFLEQRNWITDIITGTEIDWRAKIFGEWLSAPQGALQHILLRLQPDHAGQIRASAQKFVRSN